MHEHQDAANIASCTFICKGICTGKLTAAFALAFYSHTQHPHHMLHGFLVARRLSAKETGQPPRGLPDIRQLTDVCHRNLQHYFPCKWHRVILRRFARGASAEPYQRTQRSTFDT
jgi:hypothetical protein